MYKEFGETIVAEETNELVDVVANSAEAAPQDDHCEFDAERQPHRECFRF